MSLSLDLTDLLPDAGLKLLEDELLRVIELLPEPGPTMLVAPLVLVVDHQPVLQVGDLRQRHLQSGFPGAGVLVENLKNQMVS